MNPRKNPGIHVATVVHNRLPLTRQLLDCLNRQTRKPDSITIVDDGSTDGTGEFLCRQSNVLRIEGNGKLWWGRGLQLAFDCILPRARDGDAVLVLNDDCTFDSHYLETLVAAWQNPFEVLGSVIYAVEDGCVLERGIHLDWRNYRFMAAEPERARPINLLPTKGTLFPLTVLREVGIVDGTRFPHYLSDYDLTYRAFLRGYGLSVVENACLFTFARLSGCGESLPDFLWPQQAVRLLLGRNSKLNIVDHLRFIHFNAPREFRNRCYAMKLKTVGAVAWRCLPIRWLAEATKRRSKHAS